MRGAKLPCCDSNGIGLWHGGLFEREAGWHRGIRAAEADNGRFEAGKGLLGDQCGDFCTDAA